MEIALWVTLIVCIVSSLIAPICVFMFKRDIDKKDKKRDDDEKIVEQTRRAQIKVVVEEVIEPLKKDTEEINNKLQKVENGALSTLRNDILTCYYKCVEKGYRNDYDYQNVHHMYDAYKELNGNSYVADVIKRFDEDIPTKEEFDIKNKRKNRKSTKK